MRKHTRPELRSMRTWSSDTTTLPHYATQDCAGIGKQFRHWPSRTAQLARVRDMCQEIENTGNGSEAVQPLKKCRRWAVKGNGKHSAKKPRSNKEGVQTLGPIP